MPQYQGQHSWNAWNVSLWINNDEALYREAVRLAKRYGIGQGAVMFHSGVAGQKTPDGAPYTLRSVREAFIGIL